MSTSIVILAIATASNTFNLPPGLLSALCYVESHHEPRAINLHDNGSPSIGLCQLKVRTANWLGFRGTAKELQINPSINAYYAAKYINYQLRRFRGNIYCSVSAYNQGNCRLRPDGKAKNYYYVEKVFKAWKQKH